LTARSYVLVLVVTRLCGVKGRLLS